MDKLQQFFTYGILPEIVGKWFSRQPVSDNHNVVTVPKVRPEARVDEEDYEKNWCYCNTAQLWTNDLL